MLTSHPLFFFFFFNDTATTEIYTLSLHDALPIFSRISSTVNSGGSSSAQPPSSASWVRFTNAALPLVRARRCGNESASEDRKSTRLNSSHTVISYAVFCLKKKKQKANQFQPCESV